VRPRRDRCTKAETGARDRTAGTRPERASGPPASVRRGARDTHHKSVPSFARRSATTARGSVQMRVDSRALQAKRYASMGSQATAGCVAPSMPSTVDDSYRQSVGDGLWCSYRFSVGAWRGVKVCRRAPGNARLRRARGAAHEFRREHGNVSPWGMGRPPAKPRRCESGGDGARRRGAGPPGSAGRRVGQPAHVCRVECRREWA
jgi:hypothetical protein